MAIFLALVHHPVLNRAGQVVTTALTNVDIHDLARSGRTFGVERVYIVTPVTLQQRMVQEILGHWTEGEGAAHGRRAEAMRRVAVAGSLDEARADIERLTGRAPEVVVTGAQIRGKTIGFAALRERLHDHQAHPALLVFGTGWGLAPEVVEGADLRLPPIDRAADLRGSDGSYNHLSVRAAVAIVLDRLCGDRCHASV